MRNAWLPNPKRRAKPYLITEDAGTIVHVYWNGSALVDSKGNAWTMVGTVPQVAASGAVPAGAGPFSGSNYYATADVNDIFDTLTSGFLATAIVSDPTAGPSRILHTQGAGDTTGFSVYVNGAAPTGDVRVPWVAGTIISGSTIQSGVNVISWGRTAAAPTAGRLKVNLGSVTGATAGTTAGTAAVSKIGVYSSNIQPYQGTIYEIHVTTTDWSDAGAAAIASAVKARVGATW